MKKIFITSFLFIISVAPGFAQMVFTVINVELVKDAYRVVTARDIHGRTIQFLVGIRNLIPNKTDKKIVKPVKPPIVGTKVNVYFITGQQPLVNYENVNYKIIKPVYLEDTWYIIYKIDTNSISSGNSALIYASKSLEFHDDDIGFNILRPFPIDMQNFMGKALYSRYYNRNEYFVLKPTNKIEEDNNIFYSYISNVTTNHDPQATTNTQFQIPKSDKWVIVGDPSGNPYYGKIWISNDPNAKFKVLVFELNTDEVLFQFNQYKNPCLITLPPRYYSMELSGKRIDSILLVQRTYTMIYNGTLKMISNTPWTLYDENKLKKIYSGFGSEMVIFPKDIYQLEINGLVHQIEIKEGETLEYSDTTSQPQAQKLDTKPEIRNPVLEQKIDESSTDMGYQSVTARLAIRGTERVDVKVNGQKILSYGYGVHEVKLDHFLMPGKINKVTFSFDNGTESDIHLTGKFPDDEKAITFYSFQPGKNGLEGTSEFSYTGVKKK